MDELHKVRFTRHLCECYRKVKEFNGEQFYLTMQSVEDFIKEKKLSISLNNFLDEKNVTPEVFVSYVNQAKGDYEKFKLVCDNNELNDYLVGLMPGTMPSCFRHCVIVVFLISYI